MTRTLAIVGALLLAFASYAHTALKTSSPEADTTVAAPRAITLTFAGDVRLTSVALSDAGGREKHLDAVPTAVASKFELAIHEGLTPGKYTVVWRAVGGDTHIISGEFAFTVQ